MKKSTFESIKKGNNPEYETLKIIANELHVSLSDFFKGPGDVTVGDDTFAITVPNNNRKQICAEFLRLTESGGDDLVG